MGRRGAPPYGAGWRAAIWSDVLSPLPDFVHGFAIAPLRVAIRPYFGRQLAASLCAGLLVAIVRGVIAYMAIANSGFVAWTLAFGSFALVLGTRLPVAVPAGRLLTPTA